MEFSDGREVTLNDDGTVSLELWTGIREENSAGIFSELECEEHSDSICDAYGDLYAANPQINTQGWVMVASIVQAVFESDFFDENNVLMDRSDILQSLADEAQEFVSQMPAELPAPNIDMHQALMIAGQVYKDAKVVPLVDLFTPRNSPSILPPLVAGVLNPAPVRAAPPADDNEEGGPGGAGTK